MRGRLLAMVALLVGGALYAAAFPPHDWAASAWIALVPLLAVAARSGKRAAFLAGALYGAAFFALTVPWVVDAVRAYFDGGLLAALLFSGAICVLFVSGYVGMFALCTRRLLAGPPWLAGAAVPAVWVAGEVARAKLFSGLPWELLGHSQWRWIALIQVADWGGVYVLSYLVAAVNVGLYLVLRSVVAGSAPRVVVGAAGPLTVALALVALSVSYGHARLAAEAARTPQHRATITLVQGNLAHRAGASRVALDRSILAYAALSQEAITASHPDLLVWPEYALSDYPEDLPLAFPRLEELARQTKAGLVFGGPRLERSGSRDRSFNAAYHLAPDGTRVAYDKVHLVPFAEYRPAPFQEALAASGEVGFGAGTSATVVASAIGHLGMLICYEVIFAELARERVRAGAEVLLNLSNDGWLDTSGLGAGAQHLSIAVFRAVETRRWVARAATSGVSGFIDPTGRPLNLTATGVRAVTSALVEPRSELTIYVRWGDAFAFLCLAIAIGALLVDSVRGTG